MKLMDRIIKKKKEETSMTNFKGTTLIVKAVICSARRLEDERRNVAQDVVLGVASPL